MQKTKRHRILSTPIVLYLVLLVLCGCDNYYYHQPPYSQYYGPGPLVVTPSTYTQTQTSTPGSYVYQQTQSTSTVSTSTYQQPTYPYHTGTKVNPYNIKTIKNNITLVEINVGNSWSERYILIGNFHFPKEGGVMYVQVNSDYHSFELYGFMPNDPDYWFSPKDSIDGTLRLNGYSGANDGVKKLNSTYYYKINVRPNPGGYKDCVFSGSFRGNDVSFGSLTVFAMTATQEGN